MSETEKGAAVQPAYMSFFWWLGVFNVVLGLAGLSNGVKTPAAGWCYIILGFAFVCCAAFQASLIYRLSQLEEEDVE